MAALMVAVVGPCLFGKVHTYTDSESDPFLLNPDRGLYGLCPLNVPSGADAYGKWLKSEGSSLCYGEVYLGDFRSQELPDSVLSNVNISLGAVRSGGAKAIVRVVYAADEASPDTTLDWIKKHLAQLRPVFEDHRHAIAMFQAGIAGAWGEWHGSSNALLATRDSRQALVAVLHANLPTSPCLRLAIRRPDYGLEIIDANEGSSNDGCTAAIRMAFHNDCWLGSSDDYGTYTGRGATGAENRKLWLAELSTRDNAFGGETCVDPDTSEPHAVASCENALVEARTLGAVYLNPQYHEKVVAGLIDGGCWDTFKARLGYRLVVNTFSFPESVHPGQCVSAALELSNVGWARHMHDRPLYLRFLDAGDLDAVDDVAGWSSVEALPGTGSHAPPSEVRDFFCTNCMVGAGDCVDDSNARKGRQCAASVAGVCPSGYNAVCLGPVSDVLRLSAASERPHAATAGGGCLYIRVTVSEDGEPFFGNCFNSLFLDTDNNSDTGYTGSAHGGGYEVVVQCGNVYSLSQGAAWSTVLIGEGAVEYSNIGGDAWDQQACFPLGLTWADGASVLPGTGSTVGLRITSADTGWAVRELFPDNEDVAVTLGSMTSASAIAGGISDISDIPLGVGTASLLPGTAATSIALKFVVPDAERLGSRTEVRIALVAPDPELPDDHRRAIQMAGSTWIDGTNVLVSRVAIDQSGACVAPDCTIGCVGSDPSGSQLNVVLGGAGGGVVIVAVVMVMHRRRRMAEREAGLGAKPGSSFDAPFSIEG